MKITLLGVGGSAGTPQIGGKDGAGDWGECDPAEPRNRRTRPSIVIETDDGRYLLVDTGPDLRLQLTDHRIPRVNAVVYTHSHADHIAGLDEIRLLCRLIGTPMPIYANAETLADLRQRFDYAFKPWGGQRFFRPVMDSQVIEPGQTVDILGLPVLVIEQDHGFAATLGFRIGQFAYCTDVVRLDDAALASLHGLDIFVVDCFTRGDAHPTHANLAQVETWIAQLRPRRTILTHLGPTMDYGWLKQNLPPHIECGYDGMVVYSTNAHGPNS